MAEKRIRRSKKDIVIAEIAKIDKKIEEYQSKLAELSAQKEEQEAKLREIADAENKAKQEAESKEIMALIRKKGVTLDGLKAMLDEKE